MKERPGSLPSVAVDDLRQLISQGRVREARGLALEALLAALHCLRQSLIHLKTELEQFQGYLRQPPASLDQPRPPVQQGGRTQKPRLLH